MLGNNPELQDKAKKARMDLIRKGYICLPYGSYIKWIHKEWLSRYMEKRLLVLKNGIYVPILGRLQELAQMDFLYKQWLDSIERKRKIEQAERKDRINK